MRFLVLGLFAIFCGSTIFLSAASDLNPVLVGTVTRVIDGDTLDVKLSSGPIRVRLYGIDAPEKKQVYAPEAKGSLERLWNVSE